MVDLNYSAINTFKIAVMGSAAVGKTCIVNRLINNYFPLIYEPTMDIERYTGLFNLNEYEVQEKTYVMVTLEDMFGLNNPLLQTPIELMTSAPLREKREYLSTVFKDMMFTSLYKRDRMSSEQKKVKPSISEKIKHRYEAYEKIFNIENEDPKNERVDRLGFILVCDVTDYKSFEDLNVIIEKLHQIEKTNNLVHLYPKLVLLNKYDKASDKDTKANLKKMTGILETLKKKCNLEYCKVSALTNQGIFENFRKFISKIHHHLVDQKQKEGFEDQDNDPIEGDEVI
jgi:GTPase SAR1 family protein